MKQRKTKIEARFGQGAHNNACLITTCCLTIWHHIDKFGWGIFYLLCLKFDLSAPCTREDNCHCWVLSTCLVSYRGGPLHGWLSRILFEALEYTHVFVPPKSHCNLIVHHYFRAWLQCFQNFFVIGIRKCGTQDITQWFRYREDMIANRYGEKNTIQGFVSKTDYQCATLMFRNLKLEFGI